VETIIGLFAAQARAAKPILVMPLAGFEAPRFFKAATRRKRRALHIRRAYPHGAPARARGADIEIHFPTWAETIAFVRSADGIHDFAAYGITEICQTVEWFERARFLAIPRGNLLRCFPHLGNGASAVRPDTLLVPGEVG
jgi:hypothetical protein